MSHATPGQPKRIQLSRTKGWRKPAGVVVVTRPGRWGNQFRVGDFTPIWERERWPQKHTRATAVEAFREFIADAPAWRAAAQRELAGRDLACWCPLDQPCHADVLLEIANGRS